MESNRGVGVAMGVRGRGGSKGSFITEVDW